MLRGSWITQWWEWQWRRYRQMVFEKGAKETMEFINFLTALGVMIDEIVARDREFEGSRTTTMIGMDQQEDAVHTEDYSTQVVEPTWALIRQMLPQFEKWFAILNGDVLATLGVAKTEETFVEMLRRHGTAEEYNRFRRAAESMRRRVPSSSYASRVCHISSFPLFDRS